ncbi:STAS domain-containing protein [Spirillospora sp. CA-294931]|uniref:STAS domain-containing protein n=1 Tax=Spirillospora sp. CA-294931 TaxID=3240042 RepID=UPI003D915C58
MTYTDPPPTRAGIELTVLRRTEHTIVKLRGELDIATAPVLREGLVAALRPGTRRLILDLAGVPFCDAAGLAVLIGTRRRAAALGIVLLLTSPGPQVTSVLRVTGLDRSLPVRASVTEALAGSDTGAVARASR